VYSIGRAGEPENWRENDTITPPSEHPHFFCLWVTNTYSIGSRGDMKKDIAICGRFYIYFRKREAKAELLIYSYISFKKLKKYKDLKPNIMMQL